MLRQKRFRLLTLGQLRLVNAAGRSDDTLATRPRKLALLALLALAQRPLSRDAILEMFWGEQDESRARHSLSDALSHLRRALGSNAIVALGANVSLAADAPLDVDALIVTSAASRGDHELVTQLYLGPFMAGVHVGASDTFERWLTRERQRLELVFLKAAARQCETLARDRRWDDCVLLAGRWLDAAPTSPDAALFILNALKAPDTRDAHLRALAEYDRLVLRLADDYTLEPDAAVASLAESIRQHAEAVRARQAPTPVVREPDVEVSAESSAAPKAFAQSPPLPRVWMSLRRRTSVIAATALVVVAALGFVAARQATNGAAIPSASKKPLVAIVRFAVEPQDTAMAWLADGLPQMMRAALARVPTIDVVSSARVLAILERAGAANSSAEEVFAELGRRLGATVVVGGRVAQRDTLLMLDLKVRHLATDTSVALHTLVKANALNLADEAAVRVLSAADVRAHGTRLADLETSSVEAYEQYIMALSSWQVGRAADALRAVDAAIALDSSFISALYFRSRFTSDSSTRERLRAAIARHEDRATEWDRLNEQGLHAVLRGERARSEALGRLIVARFPREPEAYAKLAEVFETQGRWAEADAVLRAALTLDSLGMEAGKGPCVPCVSYGLLASGRSKYGNLEAAHQAALRWVELQPDVAAAWLSIAWIHAYRHRHDEAIRAAQRAISLWGGEEYTKTVLGRFLIMARRWAAADSTIASWRASRRRDVVAQALDLRALLERERGQFRRSIATIDTLTTRYVVTQSEHSLRLMSGNALSHLGDSSAAVALYEDYDHGASRAPLSVSLSVGAGQRARAFAWHHALEADAIGAVADTAYLRALADSVERIGSHSYFGRDWRVHHHIRGLIAARAGRHADAVREFQAARWEVGGWTRTNIEMAKSQMQLGRPRDALQTLRDAYVSQLDGMGRYAPRSEIDYHMAIAFKAAGMRDSAAVYAAHVRRAWVEADPEVKALLRDLP